MSANTWDDIIHPNGEPLHVGTVNIPASRRKEGSPPPFVGGEHSPPPREVKAALVLSLQLCLSPNHDDVHDVVKDTAMYNVSCRNDTNGVNASVCSKGNKEMLQDIVDFVAYNLVFNEFSNRARYDEFVDDEVYGDGIRDSDGYILHNREAIMHFLKSVDEAAFRRILGNPKLVRGRDLKTIMDRRRDVLRKYTKGGIKTHHQAPTPTTQKATIKMWIHHLFLLQFILPVIHKTFHDGVEDHVSYQEDWSNFMSTVHVKYGDSSIYQNVAVWMGTDRRPRGS